jgi:hypothetical protein
VRTKAVVRAWLLAGPAILLALPATAGCDRTAEARRGVGVGPARPGRPVRVSAFCGRDARSAAVSSPAWGTVRGPVSGTGRMAVAPTVRGRVLARSYPVTVMCGTGRRLHGWVAVERGGRGPEFSHRPLGAPMTGGGGDRDTGPVRVPLGLTLLAAALGTGGLSLRRSWNRARGRG